MKMNDVQLKSVLREGSTSIEPVLEVVGIDSIEAVEHAVINHDALVELNKELVEAVRELEGIALALCGEGYNYSLTVSETTLLLCKAKELLKEQGDD